LKLGLGDCHRNGLGHSRLESGESYLSDREIPVDRMEWFRRQRNNANAASNESNESMRD
jgi:hypothetical protein